MLFYKTTIIISFLCGASTTVETAPGLSVRALYLQANVTAEIKKINNTLENAFIPIDDFNSELSDVMTASLNHNDPAIQKYITENQYKYWALVYRFLTDNYLAQLVKDYGELKETSLVLIKDIDDHGVKMEEILKKRGCSEEQIRQYLDRFFEKMHFVFLFEFSYLDRMASLSNTIGSESFYIHKNIVGFLYDCYDTADLKCYQDVSDFNTRNLSIFGIESHPFVTSGDHTRVQILG